MSRPKKSKKLQRKGRKKIRHEEEDGKRTCLSPLSSYFDTKDNEINICPGMCRSACVCLCGFDINNSAEQIIILWSNHTSHGPSQRQLGHAER